MYRTKRFAVLDLPGILADIDEARAWPHLRRAFLLDGDALAAPTDLLADVLAAIRDRLPWIQRVGVYGDARSIIDKGAADMTRLRELGLGIVYHGLESGSETVLQRIGKPLSPDQMAEVGCIMHASGVQHSVMALLGLGGTELTSDHATATARALTAIDPDYIGLLTLMVVPGTPLAARHSRGDFTLPDSWGMLSELRTILSSLTVTQARFSANHASNFLPIKGDLPGDKERLLALVDRVLDSHDDGLLRPDWRRGL
ncbi:radical SAM protein [Myxococcota bacterium]|nr:radical SAM protein [Myxococcota bacterium]